MRSFKSGSKFLAAVLAVMMLMSLVTVGFTANAANVDVAPVAAETMTIYFENNWKWPDAKIYWWGSTTGTNPAWNGVSMTKVDTTDAGYDRYSIEVPTDITGMLFNGTGEYGAEQSADIKSGWYDGICYYMTYDSATNTKPCASYKYEPLVEETTAAATTAAATTAAATTAAATTAAATTAAATTAAATTAAATTAAATTAGATEELLTVYFTNNWCWSDVCIYYWGTDADPLWPGYPMTLLDDKGTENVADDLYVAEIPFEITAMIINGLKDDGSGDRNQTPNIEELVDNRGYSMTWNGENAVVIDDSRVVADTTTAAATTAAATTAAATTAASTTAAATTAASTTAAATTAGATEELLTVYFTNNWCWSDVCIYYWGTDADPTWPGIPMTLLDDKGNTNVADDLYVAEIPFEITAMIINGLKDDGSGNRDQTPDITELVDNRAYSMTWNNQNDVVIDDSRVVEGGTTAAATTAAPVEYITIYFENTVNWTTVNAYFFGGSDTPSWPGTAMTPVEGEDGLYSVQIPNDATGLIFNNGSTQTVDLTDIGADRVYYLTTQTGGKYNAEWYAYGDDVEVTTAAPVAKKTVYFTNAAYWTGDIYCYSWYDGANGDPSWPGVKMTLVETNEYGQDVYSAEVAEDIDFIIFNNNNGTQTDNLDATTIADGYGVYIDDAGKAVVFNYVGGDVVPSQDETSGDEPATPAATTAATTEDTTVYFSNGNYWTNVSIYTWTADGEAATWPGTAMTLLGKNEYGQEIYSAVVPAGTVGMIFNGTEGQTVDIRTIEALGYYPSEEVEGKWTVGTYEFDPSFIVPDTTGDETTGDEPATTATATAAGTTAAATTSGTTNAKMVTIYFSNNWYWDTPYVYYFDSAIAEKPEWPGNEMTFVETNGQGEGIYKATVPSDAAIIFVGVNEDGTVKEQSADLKDLTLVDNAGFYMIYDEATATKTVGTYTYVPKTETTEDQPTTTAPATTAPATTAPADVTVTLMGEFNDWAGIAMTVENGVATATLELEKADYKFKILEGDAWLGNNGTIVDTTTATSETGWTMNDGDGDCVLSATGGTYTFAFNLETNKLIITYVPAEVPAANYYTVVFLNADGTFIDVQMVAEGKAATAPEAPTMAADAQYTYTFKEWDTAFDSVTENLIIRAVYDKI
ncbi:MAG: starch-binding protein, partial [Ruminococcus sp.]|nr:starch-binding protein [Ruminococcus sp.]